MSVLRHTGRLRTYLAVIDVVGLSLAVWTAFFVRFSLLDFPKMRHLKIEALFDTPGLIAWGVFCSLALAAAAELFEPEILHRRREVLIRVAIVVAAWGMMIIAGVYLRPDWNYGRGLLALTMLFWALQLILTRWLFTSWRRKRARFPALVVGDPEAAQRFCDELAKRPAALWTPIDGTRFSLEHIPEAVEKHQASVVILAGGDEHALDMGHDLADLHFSGVPVVAASEIWAWLEERLPLEALTPAIFLHQPGFGAVHWTLFNRLTRILDILFAAILIVVSLPIFLLAGLLVLLTDGSPVLYEQQRVGRFGRLFTMYKLRTMTRDAEARGPEFAAKSDPRVTRVGKILRRFRIDEIPQFVNVLRGEMSLVGPRPERPEYVAQLTEKIPFYAFRIAVPPGISGWAQVNTSYAADDLEDHRRKLEFDLYFIRERSMRLYLLTLLRTVSAALVGVRR